MGLTLPNKTQEQTVGASLFAPVPPERIYGLVRDVRGFPLWAPGVRRVEVLHEPEGPGMTSNWEVSFLGIRKTIRSVLEEDEFPHYLRWTYDGPVEGWGECEISALGNGAIAKFKTELYPREAALKALMQTSAARSAATTHLRRALAKLGQTVSHNARVTF